ncbi:hypothetical protein HQ524_00805, partial [Candidatus Uhrbacteria bacterium]|nr:hypothetical protein [Candidatus Uhrbacteria bacterium]
MKRRKYKSKKSRANPYFRSTENKHISRSLVLFVLSISGIIGIMSVFIYAPFVRLSIGDVVGGSEEINLAISQKVTEQTQKHSWWIFPRNHKLFFSEEALSAYLLAEFPLNAASIELANGLVNISIAEKVSTFYLLKDDVMFAVDRSGTVLGVVEDLDRARIGIEHEEGKGAPMINDNRSSVIGEGETALSSDWLEDIVRLFDQVQSQTMLTPETANLSDEEGRVDIETDAGVTLYFTLNRPIDSQIDKLEALIDRKLVN